ncbi:MAG: energy-coupling factor transporter ATPase [Clostridiales bacterium]|mgnify:CR=1 FL=1|jgi:energy-coupling factor transport system ATP-binding protein|nr:energy-coupling factor transporter ATPase [Clostridiales bacterium]
MKPIIQVKDVHFRYSGEEHLPPVLNGASLEIEEGSFVVILGHNGSGKSTLAKHLNGILIPNEGCVLVDGMDTRDASKLLDIRRTVGMVFQNPDNQMVASVVEDDVAFAPENLGIPPKEIRSRVDEALKLVDMYEYRLHAPHLLSGGQKQRVAIAGVIAMRPRCIVLDEPTAMLDPAGRQEVIGTIKRLCRENGITIVLITHHMNEAVDADKVFVMSNGRVISQGTPKEVFSNVEFLKSEGLTVPDTAELLYKLRLSGIDLPAEALSIEECAQAIAAALK